MPQIKEHNGRRKWVVAGDVPISGDSAASAIQPNGEKILGLEFLKHDVTTVHPASYDCDARLALMDDMGVSHGIVYPNVAGFGNQNFLKVDDRALRIACVEIYNDYMAELQEKSEGRILPMALVPWWDIEALSQKSSAAMQWTCGVSSCARIRTTQACRTSPSRSGGRSGRSASTSP